MTDDALPEVKLRLGKTGRCSAIALARPLSRRGIDWLADTVGRAWDQLVDAMLRTRRRWGR